MPTSSPLAALKARRVAVEQELSKVEAQIAKDYAFLTAPPPPTNNRFENILSVASRAWFVADGVMTGYKLFCRLNGLTGIFRRKKSKR